LISEYKVEIISRNALTSFTDPIDIVKKYLNSFFEPLPYPSAILADIEVEALRIWSFKEKLLLSEADLVILNTYLTPSRLNL